MYIIDSHIHQHDFGTNVDYAAERARYLSQLKEAGVTGSQVMSIDPLIAKKWSVDERLDDLLAFTGGDENLYPFYWINPLESDALDQVDRAVERGIVGFKMICSEYYPGDDKPMEVLNKIAKVGKPVLFHSGILWDGMVSANHNRPGNFEPLLFIPNLKFCLAHISWPWTDECIAVYGKFNQAFGHNPDLSCEMFIDVTPGTPHVYREEVFKRLFCSDYQVKYNVMFGSDCSTDNYNVKWTKEWLEQDVELIKRFHPGEEEDVLEHVYAKNFLRFIGKSDEKIEKIFPDVAV